MLVRIVVAAHVLFNAIDGAKGRGGRRSHCRVTLGRQDAQVDEICGIVLLLEHKGSGFRVQG